MHEKQHGFTQPGFSPAYINARETGDLITVTVRNAAKDDGGTGDVASIEMSRDDFLAFLNGAAGVALAEKEENAP
jgi:hypothetical protein